MPDLRHPKYVYAIYSPAAKQFKIGVSVAPEYRMREFQKLHGSKLVLVTYYPEPGWHSEFDEAALHHRLAGHRLIGEWFRKSPEVLAIVEEMKQQQALHASGVLPQAYCYACRLPIPRPAPENAS